MDIQSKIARGQDPAERSISDARLKEYEFVTQQFRELTEIRFKLLTLLPIGTIGTLAILGSQEKLLHVSAPIALFGFTTTIAISVYNLRNDQHYDELVARAAQIEREFGLYEGSFVQRPDRWHRIAFGIFVEHRWPINLVYAASAALWLLIALTANPGPNVAPDLGLFCSVVFAIVAMTILSQSRKTSHRRYRRAVEQTMPLLVGAPFGPEGHGRAADAARTLARHLGGGAESTSRFERRIRFYLDPESTGEFLPRTGKGALDVLSASLLLGQTIDMPSRWIRDIYTGRRG
ncbi:MAG TPA: hypothetical protein VI072_01450 [Polyangiaceae bacterium]